MGSFQRMLPLRLRFALATGVLVLTLSAGLLIFINTLLDILLPKLLLSAAGALPLPAPPATMPKDAPDVPLLIALISMGGFILVLVLGMTSAYWVAGIALRPLRRMRDDVQRIGPETLDQRLHITQPPDELTDLAQSFDAMLERIATVFASQSQFVADAAHELRTPLASLRTNLEAVTADQHATLADYQAMAETQERAIARLEKLVADCLLLTKSEQPYQGDVISLGPLLEGVLDELASVAAQHQVSLHLSSPADEILIEGNGELLTRAFLNLVENAIVYNTVGGSVRLTIVRAAPGIRVEVTDTGNGIAPAALPAIFERFYRGEPSRMRRSGGAGLGLAIVASIIHHHHGTIRVASLLGKGSTFTICLPNQLAIAAVTARPSPRFSPQSAYAADDCR